MEIINSEYRKNILSNCCNESVFLNSTDCSKCLEPCSFILEKPTAFQKMLFTESKTKDDPIKFLIELMRNFIIKDQNQMVFELLDMCDTGESQFNRQSLERVADVIMQTSKKINMNITKLKQIKNNKKLKNGLH